MFNREGVCAVGVGREVCVCCWGGKGGVCVVGVGREGGVEGKIINT